MNFELKKEKANKMDRFYDAKQKVQDCMHNDVECKIEIIDSLHSMGFKELVALAVEEYIISHRGLNWETSNINKDINSENLANYLNNIFPEEAPWVVNSSQFAFDIYSLKARVSVELKSAKGRIVKKRGDYSNSGFTVGNATIYPPEAKVKDIVPQKNWDISWDDDYLNSMLDVLVVFTSKINGKLNDYRIVDGYYWGFSFEDYLSCREFFNIINDPDIMSGLFELILAKYPNQLFTKRMLSDRYDGNVKLQLRKLIHYTNPLGV